MRIQYLIIFLICAMFSRQSWAPPPGKGGATGGTAAGPDISKCDLKPREQTKVTLQDKSGKINHICTGTAFCGGKQVPVSCQVSDREPCPTAKLCIKFQGTLPQGININRYNFPNNVNYWTEDRIQNARPDNLPQLDFALLKKVKKPDLDWLRGDPEVLVRTRYPVNFKPDPNQKTGKAFLEKNEINDNTPNGKLTFTRSGENKYCSASVVFVDHPKFKGKVVVTSAHCLFSREDNVWVTNPAFIPGLKSDTPTGKFPVKSVIFASDWIDPNTPLPYRLDAVVLELYQAPKGNCCYGIYLNHAQGPGLAMGYPGAPFTAKDLYSVLYERDGITPYTPTQTEPVVDNIFWKMDSDMKHGSSGGPWIGYDPTGRIFGFITGLNSYGSKERDNLMVSPALGDEFKEIYKCLIGERVCPPIN